MWLTLVLKSMYTWFQSGTVAALKLHFWECWMMSDVLSRTVYNYVTAARLVISIWHSEHEYSTTATSIHLWYLWPSTQMVSVSLTVSSRWTETDIECRLRVRVGVHQRSMLGLVLFTLHSPLSQVISTFDVNQTQYTDNTLLFIALKDANSIPRILEFFHAVQQLQRSVDEPRQDWRYLYRC